jgi:hypothetical protein
MDKLKAAEDDYAKMDGLMVKIKILRKGHTLHLLAISL